MNPAAAGGPVSCVHIPPPAGRHGPGLVLPRHGNDGTEVVLGLGVHGLQPEPVLFREPEQVAVLGDPRL